MTDHEAMQRVLEALDRVMSHGSAVQEAKDILRERLAQPEQDVVLAEREACAQLCDELDAMNWSDFGEYSSGYADYIRARGQS